MICGKLCLYFWLCQTLATYVKSPTMMGTVTEAGGARLAPPVLANIGCEPCTSQLMPTTTVAKHTVVKSHSCVNARLRNDSAAQLYELSYTSEFNSCDRDQYRCNELIRPRNAQFSDWETELSAAAATERHLLMMRQKVAPLRQSLKCPYSSMTVTACELKVKRANQKVIISPPTDAVIEHMASTCVGDKGRLQGRNQTTTRDPREAASHTNCCAQPAIKADCPRARRQSTVFSRLAWSPTTQPSPAAKVYSAPPSTCR